jgi:hypothetical protein
MNSRRKLFVVLAMALGLAGLVGVDRLLHRLDLPNTPVWPAYYTLMALLPADGGSSGGGVPMPDTSQDTSQSARGAAEPVRIVFLHHSTGQAVWVGSTSHVSSKILGKSDVRSWIAGYNNTHGTSHQIDEMNFPTTSQGYPWANYPYDYYNIWVKHAGDSPYMGEPTLEMLTEQYDVIVWKHCFPVAAILPDTGTPDLDSDEKRLENYKLQYAALKEKMHSFPDTKFIVWTGAAPTIGQLRTVGPTKAMRTRQFFDWVKTEWDEPGDNIFLWDFYELETEGGIFMKTSYASGFRDPHPRPDFAGKVAPLFAQRIIDVVNGQGDATSLTGRHD